MLNVEDIHTYYGDSHVLQGVSLQVERGSVAALLGRNGVGKTTLCRSIVGFTPARAGRVIFGDVDITRMPRAQNQPVAHEPGAARAADFRFADGEGKPGDSPSINENGTETDAGICRACLRYFRDWPNAAIIAETN